MFPAGMLIANSQPATFGIRGWAAGGGTLAGGAGACVDMSGPYSAVAGRTLDLKVGMPGAAAIEDIWQYGGGGGRTDVYAPWLSAYLLIAASGGGGIVHVPSGQAYYLGGAGGDVTAGQDGQTSSGVPAKGATATAGGHFNGTAYAGGGAPTNDWRASAEGGWPAGGNGVYSRTVLESHRAWRGGGGDGRYGGGAAPEGDTASGAGGVSYVNPLPGCAASAFAGSRTNPGLANDSRRGPAGGPDKAGKILILHDGIVVAVFDGTGTAQSYTFPV